MLRTVTYNDIDPAAWRKLVRESKTGTWFQSPEAYAFLSTQTQLLDPFVIGVEDSGLQAVCVGYVTRESSPFKQFFTRRAIIYGGVCIADNARDGVIELLLASIRTHVGAKAIYIETRNFNDYSPWQEAFVRAGFAYKPHLNVQIDCREGEQLLSHMSETRRKQLRRAERSGVEVSEANSPGEIDAWYAILQEMYRQKVKTPLWPKAWFEDAYRSRAATYLMVRYDGQVIGGLMLVEDADCVYEWYVCGRDEAYERQYPSVVATWAGMQYAHAQGKARCDLMGAGEPGKPYGVRDFKERFGGQTVEHGRFLSVTKPLLYRFGVLGVKIVRYMC